MSAEFPVVTVVIPTLNESRTIEACLRAVVAQDVPRGKLEVLVLDGGSVDTTRELVEAVASTSDVPIRLVENPQRSVPAALNRAIEAARGDYLVRVDGHSVPVPDYVRRSVEGNIAHDADLAGGWVRAESRSAFGAAVAAAFASPFAMGNPGAWRQPDGVREILSVPCGSYRLETLRRLGGFDEGQRANQDYELNYRLRRAGGRAVLLPDVSFAYVPRSSVRSLARQFFRYGFYKARTMAKHPSSIRPRHLVPSLAFVVVVALVALAPTHTAALWALAALALAYAGLLVVATLTAKRTAGASWRYLPLTFATMHVAWGAGSLTGLARWLPVARSL